MSDTFDTVRDIAAEVFLLPIDSLHSNTSPDDLPEWDSLRQLYLILALEERFGLQLAPEDMEKLTTLGEIARVIDSRLPNRSMP